MKELRIVLLELNGYQANPRPIEDIQMRIVISSVVLLALAGSAWAQEQPSVFTVNPSTRALNEMSSLPIERIGPDDLLNVTVFGSAELTGMVRVSSDGDLQLPLLKEPIKAAGLFSKDLEKSIAVALVKGQLVVDPVVRVSVLEYRSRPITVAGAVKKPVVFQATGLVTLLDAISQAEGLTENAGPYIIISHSTRKSADDANAPAEESTSLAQRISVRDLLSGEDPALNIRLRGGEEIRIPEAGRIFVVGNVKRPGAFYVTDGSESSVLKALALSEGLEGFPSHTAYIYRNEASGAKKDEIKVELKQIMDRKAPDVALEPNDILYIPSATGTRASLKVLEESLGLAGVIGAASIYTFH
jgi:polysaccharide export outer membrane protein